MLNTWSILICVNFAATLKQLRRKAGITQAELAEAIGTTQGAVAHYEMGIKAPELAKLPALAKALGVTVPELFADTQNVHQTASKTRGNPNKRAAKLQKVFEKLKPAEQQLILKQIEGIVAKR